MSSLFQEDSYYILQEDGNKINLEDSYLFLDEIRPVLVSVEKTERQLIGASFSYNEAGKSYNEAGEYYGGMQGKDSNAPILEFVDKNERLRSSQLYSYNETGLSYNNTGIMYGGLYGNQGKAPKIYRD
jgi:hypothetical protein